MAFDTYLKIDGIQGEALDEQHKDCIEITGYSFSTHQTASATASSTGGATSGRTVMTDFTFTKELDRSSCKILEASCAGEHIREVRLKLCRASGEKMCYFEIVLEEVIISNFLQYASEGIPLETVSLNYGRLKTIYTLQKRVDGTGGGNVAGGWDRVANRKYC